jgi:hypothetical protein
VKARLGASVTVLQEKEKKTAEFIEKAEAKQKEIKVSAEEVRNQLYPNVLNCQVRKGVTEQMEALKALIESKTKELLDMVNAAEISKEQAIENELKFARERGEKFQKVLESVQTLQADEDKDINRFCAKV